MKLATTYDAAEFLETDEDIVAYLNATQDDGDPALVSTAFGNIARTRSMTQLAKEAGITRDGLCKALPPNGQSLLQHGSEGRKGAGLQTECDHARLGLARSAYGEVQRTTKRSSPTEAHCAQHGRLPTPHTPPSPGTPRCLQDR